MTTKRIAAALIALNLVLLFSPLRPAFAQPATEGVRAQIIITRPTRVGGVAYPEGTLLRLSDPDGHPNVKIGSDGRGAGVAFSGTNPDRNTWYGVQILSQDGESVIKVVDKAGREAVIRP